VKFINFLLENWDNVIVVLILGAAFITLAVRKEWKLIDKILFGLVTWAEREYGGGTGSLKLSAVLEKFYPKIPAIIRFFVSADTLETIVEKALESAKEKWSKNPKLLETTAQSV
jgi:hypothetical protein